MKRGPLNPISPKTKARNEEAAKPRNKLKASVGHCEFCGRENKGLIVHEILRGYGYRDKAQDKPFCTLVLCTECHREMDGMDWSEQLAILKRSRCEDYRLDEFHKLASRVKPDDDEVELWFRRFTFRASH